jgi:GH25 family lysozyme M1 (1,4-beta-N-acetylmuramidase)
MALTGIDISKWQAGLNPGAVPCGFVIAKATEGNGYTDASCAGFVDGAIAAGKLVGVYHFARPDLGNSAQEEAEWFVSQVKGWVGRAVLILDWEAGNLANVAWAKAWLDRVTATTGVRPLIYMSASPASAYDWSAVSGGYGLWIAGYPTGGPTTLGAPDCPYRPGHGWQIAMWQYTSSGTVPGYGGRLDLDVFYGDRAAWGRYAAKNGTSAPTPAPAPGPQPTPVTDITGIQRAAHVTADNIAGPLTRTAVSLVAQASTWGGVRFPNGVAATQHAVGTSADGVWGDNSRAAHDRTVIAIQQALRALGYAIAVDGIWGDHTEAAVTDALNRAEQP